MRGYEVTQIIAERASDLNEGRLGLKKLLSLVESSSAEVVLVEYPDRLARFGFHYLAQAFEWKNVRLEVLDPPKSEEPTEEMVQDMLTIVTVFAGRLSGHRAHAIRKRVEAALKEETDGTSYPHHQTGA